MLSTTSVTAAARFYLRDKNRYFIKSSKFHEFMSAALMAFHTLYRFVSSMLPEENRVFAGDLPHLFQRSRRPAQLEIDAFAPVLTLATDSAVFPQLQLPVFV